VCRRLDLLARFLPGFVVFQGVIGRKISAPFLMALRQPMVRGSRNDARRVPILEWRRAGKGSGEILTGLPSFLPSFSKSGLFLSKYFQTNLWRFCGISIGYNGKKLKESTSKFFRRAHLVFDAPPMP
jgi:hypothetical protein